MTSARIKTLIKKGYKVASYGGSYSFSRTKSAARRRVSRSGVSKKFDVKIVPLRATGSAAGVKKGKKYYLFLAKKKKRR